MPYKSIAQAAYMHIHHPEIAQEFDDKTPEHAPGELPQHVAGSPFIKKGESAHPIRSKLRKPKAKRGG